MVWQQNVEKIVMVTNLVEERKDKCEKYWPSLGATQMYGEIQVLCQRDETFAEFTRRTFDVSKDTQTRSLTQLHFTSWPDKDVPKNVTSIIEFRQKVLYAPATLGGPTLVHCSAGDWRTGTYLAIDILTKEGEAEGAIDIPGCVLNMRQNRPIMVQTAVQYAYLHYAILHSLIFDCKPVTNEKFKLRQRRADHRMKPKQLQETPNVLTKTERELMYNDIAVYLLADNQVLKNGIFSVRCSKPEASEYRNKRRLTVEHRANQANETLSLTYLKFTEWNTGEQKPILIHCRCCSHRRVLIAQLTDYRDGANKCGLFCVVATLLQRMEVEREVNVANAAQNVKARRKGDP
ncbi:hypothetical protein DPMN_021642 [Dreissena polymorpha]|uniref:protein-tyrosine-phosphatase n=1 Tax=Dreissena polymorpha TaxID=45954 RepID=A0A9D4NPC2_DREPO|nr:hypothetical protein DPMN_021642 [Dreissena polymorpha]